MHYPTTPHPSRTRRAVTVVTLLVALLDHNTLLRRDEHVAVRSHTPAAHVATV